MVATASTAFRSVLPVLVPEPDVVRPSFPTVPRTSREPRPRFRLPSASPLPTEPFLFEWLGRRFAPSEATFFVGPPRALESLLELVYAGCVSIGGRISLLEGSNRFHPYRVGERARSMGVDPGEALGAIRIARAFTGYQMASLVDGWTREIRRSRPTLLVAHDVPAMFFESEFPAEEREPLLRHVATTLAETVRTTRLPLLLTSPHGFAGFPGLAEHGPRLYDLLRVTPGPGGTTLEGSREAARLALVDRPDGQRGLEEFLDARREVTTWDAPYRPIGRRSRND